MQPPTPERLATLTSTSQEAIATFLSMELDLAGTMVNVTTTQPEQRDAALDYAHAALGLVRHLEGRIQDPALWRAIHARTDELEAILQQHGAATGDNDQGTNGDAHQRMRPSHI